MKPNPWSFVMSSLWAWSGSQPPLAEWLMAAKPGDKLLVPCDTAPEKGNVQSRVNRIVKTRRIKAAATRVDDGVIVERL